MAGGPWIPSEVGQGRPGLFINFVPVALAAISPGVRGVVATIIRAPWGPLNTAQDIETEADLQNYYTNASVGGSNAYYEIHHAFLGGARMVKAYRIAGSGSAKSMLQVQDGAGAAAFNLNGKYEGAYGNTFSVVIQTNPVLSTATDILLYQGTTLVTSWTTSVTARGQIGHIAEICALINQDSNNYSISATFIGEGNSVPAAVAKTSLSGGADGAAPTTLEYSLAMVALEGEEFNTFHTDITDAEIPGISASIKAWILGMRNFGKYVTWVTGSVAGESLATARTNAAALNSEAIMYFYPGVYEVDPISGSRKLYRGAAYAATIAGKRSALVPGEDMTFWLLPNIVGLEAKLSNAQVKQGLAGGLMLGVFDGLQYKIEEGLNALVTLNANQGDEWKYVDAINTMDALATGITISANANYVGKIPNDEVGQNALINATRDFLRSMANSRAIEPNFTVGLDPRYDSSGRSVFLLVGIQPIQTMKFIYFTIQVS